MLIIIIISAGITAPAPGEAGIAVKKGEIIPRRGAEHLLCLLEVKNREK